MLVFSQAINDLCKGQMTQSFNTEASHTDKNLFLVLSQTPLQTSTEQND